MNRSGRSIAESTEVQEHGRRPRALQRLGGALAVVAGCSAPLPTSPAASAPASIAASAEPVVAEPEPSPPPAPPPDITYDGARAERLARLTRTALGVVDAFANVSPQPVVRGYTEVPHVQFQTDRRDPGSLRWVESPTVALHHWVTDATKVEPCARPLAPGGEARLGDVPVRLVRGADHDEVRFGDKKPVAAKLPRGASHGACVGLEGTRLWISWSTPTTPPELFTLSRRDGSSRPLRIDARPGLALLDDVRATEVEGVAAVLEPKHGARATALVIDDDGAPLARWSPLARFLADAGVKTLVTSRATLPAALALARTTGPVTIVLRRAMGLVAVQDPVVLIGESADAFEGVVPAGTTIVAAGPALAESARAAASRAGGKLAIAPGAERRRALAAAWARVADAVLPDP